MIDIIFFNAIWSLFIIRNFSTSQMMRDRLLWDEGSPSKNCFSFCACCWSWTLFSFSACFTSFFFIGVGSENTIFSELLDSWLSRTYANMRDHNCWSLSRLVRLIPAAWFGNTVLRNDLLGPTLTVHLSYVSKGLKTIRVMPVDGALKSVPRIVVCSVATNNGYPSSDCFLSSLWKSG